MKKPDTAWQKNSPDQARNSFARFFPGVSLDLTTEILDGSPQRVIVEKAESRGADLMVIGSHGRGFWSRTLIGSVSSSVVHHAPCSVLVVRTGERFKKVGLNRYFYKGEIKL